MVTIADFILVPVDWRVLLPDRPHIPRLSEAERSSVRDSTAPRSAQRAPSLECMLARGGSGETSTHSKHKAPPGSSPFQQADLDPAFFGPANSGD
jgi:hypothetical protein